MPSTRATATRSPARWSRSRPPSTRPTPSAPSRPVHAATLRALPVVPGGGEMDFGLTVLPDPPYSRLLELLQLGEANGFTHGWTYDSHVLWQEPFPLLTMAAERTTTLK